MAESERRTSASVVWLPLGVMSGETRARTLNGNSGYNPVTFQVAGRYTSRECKPAPVRSRPPAPWTGAAASLALVRCQPACFAAGQCHATTVASPALIAAARVQLPRLLSYRLSA